MTTTLVQQRQETAKQQAAAREAEALYRFFQNHPELAPVEANSRTLKAWHNGEEITVRSLEESLQHPDLRRRLAFRDRDRIEADSKAEQAAAEAAALTERESLIAKIVTQRSSSEMKAHLAKQYRHRDPWGKFTVSLETLRAKAAEIDARHDLRNLSVGELKQVVRDARPQAGFPPLPNTIQFNKHSLRGMSALELRKLIQRYGIDNVNRRLSGQEEN